MSLQDAVAEVAIAEGDLLKGRVVLVPDTSFSTALDNWQWWAYQRLLEVVKEAQETGVAWTWLAPERIIAQHERFLKEGKLEEFYNIPLAHSHFWEVLGGYKPAALPLGKGVLNQALIDWQNYSAAVNSAHKKNLPQNGSGKTGPGKADLEMLAFVRVLALKGAKVRVATKDVMDLVSTLRGISGQPDMARSDIRLLSPSQVDASCLNYLGDGKLGLDHVVSGEAIRDLPSSWNPNLSYPAIIFEKSVKSGENSFNVGVGVVKRECFRQFVLPAQFESVRGNYEVVPVVRIESISGESATKKLNHAFTDFNVSKLVVAEQARPYFLLLALERITWNSAGRRKMIEYRPLFRADPDFLFYHTASAFARATYVPVAQRAPRVSIPK